ncbi:hypothetical protein H310_08476 [Aphanomyces invadans]|uniref:Uncharacterized protein n=1 Tax=Aphanomyces invadans TaxID=157072 RepID=A0A024TYB9_9STRA|nr:hypothetical protein H310_08476 [Aphanomyces invadans]ETV99003.1 hypothetical protein H310_08476 [Aphanomyces invadans]|eukprot:XP_008872431.1 hypothetical protein H310_08476 [Aphanomyces invadans]
MAEQDVDILKDVISIGPYCAPYGQSNRRWTEVAVNMRPIYGESISA